MRTDVVGYIVFLFSDRNGLTDQFVELGGQAYMSSDEVEEAWEDLIAHGNNYDEISDFSAVRLDADLNELDEVFLSGKIIADFLGKPSVQLIQDGYLRLKAARRHDGLTLTKVRNA